MPSANKSKSKFLSLLLRHQPEVIGLTLDENGWAGIRELIEKSSLHHNAITFEELHAIVASDSKQRFALSTDGQRIRASQGHSLNVDLQLQPAVPPVVLYHGTAEKNRSSIEAGGILKGRRHHVHLSSDQETAMAVGRRYGKPMVMAVDSQKMAKDNFAFFKSANGVWLTHFVPPQYLRFL